jgi:hypothetical protein
MEQSKAMEYESWKALSDVLKPCNIYIYKKPVTEIFTENRTVSISQCDEQL